MKLFNYDKLLLANVTPSYLRKAAFNLFLYQFQKFIIFKYLLKFFNNLIFDIIKKFSNSLISYYYFQ